MNYLIDIVSLSAIWTRKYRMKSFSVIIRPTIIQCLYKQSNSMRTNTFAALQLFAVKLLFIYDSVSLVQTPIPQQSIFNFNICNREGSV